VSNQESVMADIKKVTMGLTPRDIAIADRLQTDMHARTKAEVVSNALSIAQAIVKEVLKGNQLIIRDKSGKDIERLRFPLVENEFSQ
jgi:hypothetical protein